MVAIRVVLVHLLLLLTMKMHSSVGFDKLKEKRDEIRFKHNLGRKAKDAVGGEPTHHGKTRNVKESRIPDIVINEIVVDEKQLYVKENANPSIEKYDTHVDSHVTTKLTYITKIGKFNAARLDQWTSSGDSMNSTNASTTASTQSWTTAGNYLAPCEYDDVLYPNTAGNVTVYFPLTAAGYSNSSITVCPIGTSSSGKPYGTRACNIDSVWETPIWLSSCNVQLETYENLTITTEEQRQEVANDLEVITSQPDQLEADNLTAAVEVLEEVVNAPNLTQQTSNSVVATIGNIMEAPEEEIKASNQSEKLLQTLDAVGAKVELVNGLFEQVTSSVALAVVEPPQEEAQNGVGYAVLSWTEEQDLGFRSDQLTTFYNQPNGTVASYIKIPFQANAQGSANRNSFYAMSNDKLFSTAETNQRRGANLQYTSHVVLSATIVGSSGKIAHLQQPVEIQFSLEANYAQPYVDKNTYCGFWDSNEWSTEGSRIISVKNETITCQFDHLTNFAALFNSNYIDSTQIDLITLIGCSISCVCLLLTIIVFVVCKPIREGKKFRGSFLLTNLSLSLLLLNICLILSGQEFVQRSPDGCLSIAVLMHFFILSSMGWMLAEGATLFAAVAFPFWTRSANNLKILIPAGIFGWLLPAVFVSCVLAADKSLYTRIDYTCWIDDDYLLYLIAIPLCIFIGINFVLYIMIIYHAVCHRAKTANEHNVATQNIMMSISLFVTLGGTWLFAIALIASNEDLAVLNVFAYIFTVLNSLQGVLIFLLCVVRQKHVRDMSRRKLNSAHEAMKFAISFSSGWRYGNYAMEETELSEIPKTSTFQSANFDTQVRYKEKLI